ncbi:cell division protein ZapE [Alishewanella longhuensis]
MTPLKKYQQDLTRPDFHHDAAQEYAVKQLQRLFDDFVSRPATKPGFWQKITDSPAAASASTGFIFLGAESAGAKPIW